MVLTWSDFTCWLLYAFSQPVEVGHLIAMSDVDKNNIKYNIEIQTEKACTQLLAPPQKKPFFLAR